MTKFKVPKTSWKSIPLDSAKFILEEGKDYHVFQDQFLINILVYFYAAYC